MSPKSYTMKKIMTTENLLLLIWGLYNTQGVFIPQGGIISRGILLVYLLFAMYCFIKVNTNKRLLTSYVKALNVLILMLTVYGLFAIITRHGSSNGLKPIYFSLLPIYSFYYIIQQKQLPDKWFRWVLFYCAFVVAIRYMKFVSEMQALLLESGIEEEVDYTINMAYPIVALVPLLWFWREKPVLQLSFFILVTLALLSTAKRGALLIAFLCFLYFVFQFVKKSIKAFNFKYVIFAFVFVAAVLVVVRNYFMNDSYLQYRWELTQNGYVSKRDIIYRKCWETFVNSNFFGMLFGHGLRSTVRLFNHSAHCDWLQFLVDYGLLGFFVYLHYWIVFIRTWITDHDNKTRPIVGTIVIIYFMSSIYSMSFNVMELPACICLAYCLAEQQRKRSYTSSRLTAHETAIIPNTNI